MDKTKLGFELPVSSSRLTREAAVAGRSLIGLPDSFSTNALFARLGAGQCRPAPEYLVDRVAMLAWNIRYDFGMGDEDDGVHSGVKPFNQDWDTSDAQGNWDHMDPSLGFNDRGPMIRKTNGRHRAFAA